MPAEELDLNQALQGHALSTLVYAGAANTHADHVLEQVCHPGGHRKRHRLRLVGDGSASAPNPGPCQGSTLRPGGFRSIGCGCPYAGRNLPCYGLQVYTGSGGGD